MGNFIYFEQGPTTKFPVKVQTLADGTFALVVQNADEERTPMPISASASGDNAVIDGPCFLRRLLIGGGAGTATTIVVRDTSTAYPAGGTVLETITVPANAPPVSIEIGKLIANGVNINLSQALQVQAMVEGLPETAKGSSGKIIFEGTIAPSSTVNVTSTANVTTESYRHNTNRSVRQVICNGTEPGRAVFSLSANGFTPITPDLHFQSISFDVYVPSHGTKFNNSAPSATGAPKLDIRVETAGGVTRYQYSSLWLHQGINRVTITRAQFGDPIIAGGDTWATGTFTDLTFLVYGGAGVATEFVVDNVRINASARLPMVVWRFDDGFRNWIDAMPYFAEKYGIPFSGFVVRDFSTNTPATYASGAELAALRERLGDDLIYIGNHTATHTGPTAMEAYTQAQFLNDEVIANETWLYAQGIWPDTSYPKHAVMPNGQFSPEIEAAWAAQGYRTNGSTLIGGVPPGFAGINPFALPQLNISGTYVTPYSAGWQAILEPALRQGGNHVIALGHSMGGESGGAVLGGAAASLNVTPEEYEPIFKRARALEDAGFIKMVTIEQFANELGFS